MHNFICVSVRMREVGCSFLSSACYTLTTHDRLRYMGSDQASTDAYVLEEAKNPNHQLYRLLYRYSLGDKCDESSHRKSHAMTCPFQFSVTWEHYNLGVNKWLNWRREGNLMDYKAQKDSMLGDVLRMEPGHSMARGNVCFARKWIRPSSPQCNYALVCPSWRLSLLLTTVAC